MDEIVVTGSRLRVSGYQAPTPVTVATPDVLRESAPTNIPSGLIQLPQFAGSLGNGSQVIGAGSIGIHANSLSLRNLQPQRTLVLLDGRRIPPSRYQGTVNVDILPELLVERVEVVTGGASAVYGSDAVAGVVNYILDTDFTGVKLNVQGGMSTYNDARSYRVGVAAGGDLLDGRAHVLFSADHAQNDPTWRQDRDPNHWAFDSWALAAKFLNQPNPGTAANPAIHRPGIVGTVTNDTGHIITGPPGLADTTFTSDLRLIPWDRGIPSGFGNNVGGTGGNTPSYMHLIAGMNTDQAFGQVTYDLTDDIKFTGNASYGRSSVHLQASTASYNNVPIFSGNPFLPPAVQAILTAANTPNTPITLSKQMNEAAPLNQREIIEGWTATAGLSGKLFGDWTFDAYYNHGTVKSHIFADRVVFNRNLYAALDAVTVTAANVGTTGLPIGSIQCRVALTNPGLYPGCAPYNPFGYNRETEAAKNYVLGRSEFFVTNEQDAFAASIQGDLFELWAGPLSVSLGAEYREASLLLTSNTDPAKALDLTGIRGAAATLPPSGLNTGVADASNNVKEVFGELSLPLLKDVPIADLLELSLAGRRTDYSTSGVVNTWKVGLSYRPVPDIRIRGTVSRDIRAPGLYDLFAGRSLARASVFDAHIQQSVTANVEGGGNPNLEPEDGKTKALGVVFQPSWLPRFALSVDWYDIRISGAIASIPANNIVLDCEDSGGTSAACALITRPLPFSNRTVANSATSILAVPINTAFLANRGVDIQANYAFELADISGGLEGEISLRALANYVDRFATQADRLAPIRELAGWTDGPMPKIRGTFGVAYSNNGFKLSGQVRHIGRLKAGPSRVYEPDHLDAINYVDVTVTRDLEAFGADVETFLTVNNLFNKTWPLFAQNPPGNFFPTLISLYDLQARYFTVGMRARF